MKCAIQINFALAIMHARPVIDNRFAKKLVHVYRWLYAYDVKLFMNLHFFVVYTEMTMVLFKKKNKKTWKFEFFDPQKTCK